MDRKRNYGKKKVLSGIFFSAMSPSSILDLLLSNCRERSCLFRIALDNIVISFSASKLQIRG